MKKAIFIFTRDLRLADNLSLNYAVNNFKKVLLLFILTPEQISKKNKFKSDNAIAFMIESLIELKNKCKNKLLICQGTNAKILDSLCKQEKFDQIIISKDYTPYSKKRFKEIKKIAKKNNCSKIEIDNHLLNSNNIKTQSDTAYSVFTPYYRKSKENKISKPVSFGGKITQFINPNNFNLKEAKLDSFLKLKSPQNHFIGGRKAGKAKLRIFLKELSNYGDTRNNPNLKTSELSVYHKFGVISARESYYAGIKLPNSEPWIRQLYWRDFYYQVADNFPRVLKNKSFKIKYDEIKWSKSKKNFKKWCKGETGFPIVDAGMNQLNEVGWMHNRLRMITASFLVKDLLIDWRWGEKYFAQNLVDYDPSQNNGGWQWAAGTGTDAQPYFRIFNPWLQSKRFDPDTQYIKKWIPELEDVSSEDIHQWNLKYKNYSNIDYPKPIVDHQIQKKKALDLYKN